MTLVRDIEVMRVGVESAGFHYTVNSVRIAESL